MQLQAIFSVILSAITHALRNYLNNGRAFSERAVTAGVTPAEIKGASGIAGQVKKGAHLALTSSIAELVGTGVLFFQDNHQSRTSSVLAVIFYDHTFGRRWKKVMGGGHRWNISGIPIPRRFIYALTRVQARLA